MKVSSPPRETVAVRAAMPLRTPTAVATDSWVWSLPLGYTCGAEQYNAERTKKQRLHLTWRLAFAFVFLLSAAMPQLAHGTKNVLLLFDENDDSLSNLVEVHISNVRKKLGKDFIKTRRGLGYVIDE